MVIAVKPSTILGVPMSGNVVDSPLAERWGASIDQLVDVGRAVGREADADFGTLGADELGIAQFEEAIESYKSETDRVLASPGAADATGQPLVLLGGLDALELVLQSAEALEFGVLSADEEEKNLAVWNARLDAYVAALSQGTALSPELRTSLKANLDALQKAGADELLALAGSDVAWASLLAMGGGLVAVGGAVVKNAVSTVSENLGRFRRVALDLFQWIVQRLRQLLPESFREWFDEQLDSLKEKVSSKILSQIADTLAGYGRIEAEKEWDSAAGEGRDLSRAKDQLGNTSGARISMIGYISTGREKVDSIAGMLTTAVGVAAPQVGIIVGSAVIVIFAFVVFQTAAGFGDVGNLAKEL